MQSSLMANFENYFDMLIVSSKKQLIIIKKGHFVNHFYIKEMNTSKKVHSKPHCPPGYPSIHNT